MNPGFAHGANKIATVITRLSPIFVLDFLDGCFPSHVCSQTMSFAGPGSGLA